MGLEEFTQLQGRKGPSCWYAAAKRNLAPKDQKSLEEALGHIDLQTRAIGRWLQAHGISIATTSIARHRRGDCACKS